jgi:MATE family multidrug resistance protein
VFGGQSLPAWTGPLRAMPAMGSAGAALATTLCILFQFAYVAAAIARIPVPAPPADLRKPDREQIARAFRSGWPIGLHLMAECGAFTLAGLLAGRMGSKSAAAHQIALTYATLSFTIVMGIGSAGSVRVGWAVGAKDTRAARRAGLVALAGGAALMSLWGLAFWTFPNALASLMTNQQDVMMTSVPLLAVAAVFQISDGIQGVGAGVLRGAGDTRFIFLANMAGHYAIGFPIALALGLWRGMGVVGIWWGLSTGLTAVAVTLYVRFWRLSSKEIRPLAEH